MRKKIITWMLVSSVIFTQVVPVYAERPAVFGDGSEALEADDESQSNTAYLESEDSTLFSDSGDVFISNIPDDMSVTEAEDDVTTVTEWQWAGPDTLLLEITYNDEYQRWEMTLPNQEDRPWTFDEIVEMLPKAIIGKIGETGIIDTVEIVDWNAEQFDETALFDGKSIAFGAELEQGFSANDVEIYVNMKGADETFAYPNGQIDEESDISVFAESQENDPNASEKEALEDAITSDETDSIDDKVVLETEEFIADPTDTLNADAAVSKSIDLYAIDSVYNKLKIPSTYPQSYQISISGSSNVSYSIVSGESVNVSSKGLITPAYDVYYWNGNIGSTTSTGAEGERKTVEYNFGTTVIEAKADQKIYRYTVTVKNYAQIYVDQVIDSYIAKNISKSMTNMEKLKKIAEFPCQYNYSASYSSATGMVINGGGDCWASTDAILRLCEKVGFEARSRDGRGDPGAGSGHMNALVKVDGKLYVVEAGYVGSAPRYYSIYEETEYRYTVHSDNKTITLDSYNGLDKTVNIPEYIDNYQVTEIGDACFCYRDELRSVTIPSSVKKIGNYAFYDTGLQTVKIPEGVIEIGNEAFSACFDYHGPGGSYGFTTSTEIVELPSSLKKLGVDLSDSTVLYHGTKAQWNSIAFSGSYKAPAADHLFYSSSGLEMTAKNVTLSSGQSQVFQVYSTDPNITVTSSNSNVQASIKSEIKEYNYYRDGSNNNVVNAAKKLTIEAVKDGTATITVKTGSGKTSACKVTVLKKQTINVNTSFKKTYGDKKFSLNASCAGGAKLSYVSDHTDVVTVSSNGEVSIVGSGTATINITAAATGQFGKGTKKVTITVKPKSIAKCQMIFTKIGTIPFGNSQFEKYLAIADGETILKEGRDYEFWGGSWSGSGNSLGSLSKYVEGIGNYTGTVTMTVTPVSQTSVLNSAVQTAKGIQLSWKKEDGALGYAIYRKKGNEKYTLVKRISNRDTTKWTDTETVNPKAVYSYYIKVYTKSGGKLIYAKQSGSKTVIPAPVVKSAASAGYNSIKVTWEAVSGADSYTLYYKGGNIKNWQKIKSGITSTSYVHSGLNTGTTYSYTVQAVSGKSSGSYNQTGKSAKPALGTVKLGKVTSAGYDRLKITWSKTAGASGYVVYQKVGGKWKKLAAVKGTSYTHVHSSAFPVVTGTANTYTVRAYRIVNKKYVYGGFSKTGITGTASLGKPVISAVVKSGNGMKLTIKKVSGAAGYEIQRYNGKAWVKIATVKSTSYTDTKASKKGTTYKYRVRAYRSVNGKKLYSSYSAAKSGKR